MNSRTLASLLGAILLGLSVPVQALAAGSLDEAYQIIKSKRFVDLTHSFDTNSPVWSGFGQAKFSPARDPATGRPYTISDDGFRSTLYELVGQYGTHVDPPAHFSETGRTMDQIPLDQMVLPLIILDNTGHMKSDPNHAFSLDDLKAWEAKHGRIPAQSFVALRTDMSKDFQSNPDYFKRSPFPAWSFEVIKFLYEERDVVATGHESLDTDTTSNMASETYILKNNHYQIEVMANLDQVPPKGSLIVVTWPKVKSGLGFPARAFAIVP